MNSYYLVSDGDSNNVDGFERIIYTTKDNLPKNVFSISRAYDTIEELKLEEQVYSEKCSVCGGVISLSTIRNLAKEKLCYKCNFCKEVLVIATINPNRVIIDGNSYHINPDKSGSKGFGGRQFKISKFNDPDKIIVTNNLWHQGEVPKLWKKFLPDTAKFL